MDAFVRSGRIAILCYSKKTHGNALRNTEGVRFNLRISFVYDSSLEFISESKILVGVDFSLDLVPHSELIMTRILEVVKFQMLVFFFRLSSIALQEYIRRI